MRWSPHGGWGQFDIYKIAAHSAAVDPSDANDIVEGSGKPLIAPCQIARETTINEMGTSSTVSVLRLYGKARSHGIFFSLRAGLEISRSRKQRRKHSRLEETCDVPAEQAPKRNTRQLNRPTPHCSSGYFLRSKNCS